MLAANDESLIGYFTLALPDICCSALFNVFLSAFLATQVFVPASPGERRVRGGLAISFLK